MFETSKDPGVEYTGFKLDWGAAFTSQVQSLTHSNTADPNVVDGVNANQLADIGFGFNNATANLYLNAQIAKGIRVALTTYLSARHHPESWVKEGYLQIDGSPIDWIPLHALMQFLTIRVGHFEINYGDAHYRRTDNGHSVYNPFVGNYMMDAFTTEIGAEVYLRARSVIAMAALTGGEVRGTVLSPGQRGPSLIGKLGVDRQVRPNLRVRADRLDVPQREVAQQHAVRRRPRRLALLLRAGKHRRRGSHAVHVRKHQSRVQKLGDGNTAESIRQVRRPGSLRRDRARARAGGHRRDGAHLQPAGGRRRVPDGWRCAPCRRALQPCGRTARRYGDGRRRPALAAWRGLVHHAESAGQGGIRHADVRWLSRHRDPPRRAVQGHHARRRGRLLTGHGIAAHRLAAAGLVACALTAHVTADDDAASGVMVTVERGTYSVVARFDVPEPPRAALAVLSDYEQIPRFMPGVRKSVIIERTPAHLVVEQEAVTQYLMFSKTVHLVLVVTQAGDTIQFTDRAHDSFLLYEGSWRVTPRVGDTGGATIAYAVTARPAFDVPGFVLKRLLTRDSDKMIRGLRREIAARVADTLPGVISGAYDADRRIEEIKTEPAFGHIPSWS